MNQKRISTAWLRLSQFQFSQSSRLPIPDEVRKRAAIARSIRMIAKILLDLKESLLRCGCPEVATPGATEQALASEAKANIISAGRPFKIQVDYAFLD